jgi:signal transduction histidine kinase/CheY-like chemotaxis protein
MQRFTDEFLKAHAIPTTLDDDDEKEAAPTTQTRITDRPRKNILASDMVHEIRLPLHNIIGALDTLGTISSDSPDRVKILRILRTSYKHMRNILSKISMKSNNMALQLDLREPLILKNLFETVEDLTIQIALKNGVQLEFVRAGITEHDYSVQKFSGDVDKITEILINLVGNAIKFSPKGETVRVQLTTINTTGNSIDLQFEVMNKGQGIPKDVQRDVLFKRCSQGAQATNTSMKASTGLGLYLSQEFAKLMGGQILVESDPENEQTDTTFHFTLNFKKEQDQPVPISSVHATSPIASPIPLVRKFQFSNKDLKIMTVDDNLQTLKLYKRNFEGAGCKALRQFDSGEEAVADYALRDYDICLIDMNMGGITGWETALKIYEIALNNNRKPPSILLCTGDDQDMIENLLHNPSELPEELALQKGARLVPKGSRIPDIMNHINSCTSPQTDD